MTLKTLAATVCLTLVTATVSFAAPVDLDFSFNGASGTFYGLDDADGSSSATSLDVLVGSRSWVGLDVSGASANTFDFMAGSLTAVNFVLQGPAVLDAAGTSTFVQTGFNLNFGQIVFADAGSNDEGIDGNPTFTPTPVPLPAGGLLLLSGLVAAAGLTRRKKRAT